MAQLQTRLDVIKDRADEINRLRREYDRLLQLQPSPGKLERIRDEVDRHGQDARVANEQPDAKLISLEPGTWAPASTWRNQGRGTPEAAVETMLWAAAGGDVSAIKDTLVLAPDARSKATEILTNLPTASQQYATAEDLTAVVVAGKVPLDSAQIVAHQQSQDDRVTEYLRLKDSGGRTRQVYLSLQKASSGWQIIVPRGAVEEIERVPASTTVP